MTQPPDGLDSQETQRELIQQRLALLGKVMLILTAFLCLVQGGLSMGRDLRRPGYWFIVASGGFWLALFLDCRGRSRSALRLRVMEALCVLGWIVCLGVGVRLLMVDQFPQLYQGMATDDPRALASLAILFEKAGAAAIVLVMSLALIIRAAAVPTSPRYTTWLTIAAGVVFGLPWAVEPAMFQMQVDRSLGSDSVLVLVVVCWIMITVACYVVSRVVHGLRAEVSDARRLGQYTLLSKIGAGGMGVVYRASHAMMRRPTAIKLLSGSGSSDAQLARFEREVQLTAKLTHPNTITIFDYGRTPDGIFYYVMELLDGASLDALVEHAGMQPPPRVVNILLQLCGALEEAHSINLIHRDIKPANIILCWQGGRPDVAKLLDFGLVKEINTEGTGSDTIDGSVLGTPQYMSPEQIRAPDTIDGRSDLYALGALGYFLLTGRHVFDSDTLIALCAEHLHTQPIPPSDRPGCEVPAQLDAIILSCLEKDREDRPASAGELAEQLRACEVGEWSVEQAREWWERNRGMLDLSVTVDSSPATIAVDLAHLR